ncbi:hypothetical protein ACFWBF_01755 [Streptomyces sp. NPDC060028]|uniref:hypothetical protein n=1 Tax=Streptomyces sp. NPDC060028 TaxID=3347041 RepID=UPI0036C70B46
MSEVPQVTREERLEGLKALFSGAAGKTRAGQALTSSGHSNLLIGALLHAADRKREGHAATDLEERLLTVLGTAVPQEEIGEWGRVYREAVIAQGDTIALVPRVIASRPVSEGFNFADLVGNWGPVVEEIMALPNTVAVSREELAAGRSGESAAFIAAMKANGGLGISGFIRPGGAPVGAASAGAQDTEGGDGQSEGRAPLTAFRAKLELDSFYVHDSVGDAGGGRDEIYWTGSSASDLASGPSYRSGEFGASSTGDTHVFPAGKRVFFEGQVRDGLGLVLYCMEADQSDDEWYDALMKELSNLSTALQALDFGNALIPGLPGADIIAIAGEAARMAVFLKEVLRNHDDLSAERAIALDRYALAVLAYRGETSWHFNGNGHHELKVKYTGEKAPFPQGSLEYAIRTGTTWGAPIPMGWDSMTAPTLTTYNGKLYAFFVRPGDNAVMWTRQEGGVWKKPERIGGDASVFAPAVVAAHGKLFYAHTGAGDALWWRTYTEAGGWTGATQFAGYKVVHAPSLAAYSNRVWLTVVDLDGHLWLNTHDGSTWSKGYSDNLNWVVHHGVAMAADDGLLWRVVRGLDTAVYTSTSDGGSHYVDRGTVTRWSISHAPALTVHDNALCIFFRHTDGSLRVSTRSSINVAWGDALAVSGVGAIKPLDSPSAVSHDGKLYVMYRRQ